jgi:hypothetical protein
MHLGLPNPPSAPMAVVVASVLFGVDRLCSTAGGSACATSIASPQPIALPKDNGELRDAAVETHVEDCLAWVHGAKKECRRQHQLADALEFMTIRRIFSSDADGSPLFSHLCKSSIISRHKQNDNIQRQNSRGPAYRGNRSRGFQ